MISKVEPLARVDRSRSAQEEGIVGRLVGGMIRRSVRRAFHTVWWNLPTASISGPAVLYANHHGWHDGYLMFHLITQMGVRCLDWITEFDAFPLFRSVGGRPFPADDPTRRIKTMRETIRLMRDDDRSLVLFPEVRLHRGPDVLPFGGALEMLQKKVPGIRCHPVAIRYQHGIHERPEAFLSVGSAIEPDTDPRQALIDELARLDLLRQDPDRTLQVLVQGTRDVNERWDMRRMPGGDRK